VSDAEIINICHRLRPLYSSLYASLFTLRNLAIARRHLEASIEDIKQQIHQLEQDIHEHEFHPGSQPRTRRCLKCNLRGPD